MSVGIDLNHVRELKRTVDKQAELLHRWNVAASQHGFVAGSEYIDDPERTMKAIRGVSELHARFSVALAEKKQELEIQELRTALTVAIEYLKPGSREKKLALKALGVKA